MAQQMVDCDSRLSSDHTELSGPDFTSTAHQGNLIDHQGSIFTSANMSAHVIDRVMLWLSDDGFGKWLLVLDNADDVINVNLPQLLLQKSRKENGGQSYTFHTLQISFVDVM